MPCENPLILAIVVRIQIDNSKMPHPCSTYPHSFILRSFPYCFRIVSVSFPYCFPFPNRRTIGERQENDRRMIGERYGNDTEKYRRNYWADCDTISCVVLKIALFSTIFNYYQVSFLHNSLWHTGEHSPSTLGLENRASKSVHLLSGRRQSLCK